MEESKSVCGSLKGPRKMRVRPPEPLPTLRLRLDSERELRRPPKQQEWWWVQSLPAAPTPQLQAPAGCARQGGGSLGRFPALSAEACGVSSERLFSIHGATQSLPHLLSTASPVI